MSAAEVLAIVSQQFNELREASETQLTRTGQLQQEIDGLRRDFADMHQQLQETRDLVKQVIALSAKS